MIGHTVLRVLGALNLNHTPMYGGAVRHVLCVGGSGRALCYATLGNQSPSFKGDPRGILHTLLTCRTAKQDTTLGDKEGFVIALW